MFLAAAWLGTATESFAQTGSTTIITGTISTPGERDVHTFQLNGRERFYFDALSNSGEQSGGQPVPQALGSPGRVVYLGAEPLLEIAREDLDVDLFLYSRPTDNLTLDSTTDLLPVIGWQPYWQGASSNLMEVFSLTLTNQARYFRAVSE
jgi:hypothetical protein